MKTLRRWMLSIATAAPFAVASAQQSPPVGVQDQRAGLRAGIQDAGMAASGMKLIGHGVKPADMTNAANPGDFGFLNSDLAFRGHYVYQGNFHGFQLWDVSNPSMPKIRMTYVCPGGQGDLSVYKNLLFMSVEETRGRLDCGGQGVQDTVSTERFRGVRIFDITDLDHPKQIADVQTCRGSHTHTLVVDPKDTKNVYLYVGGTAGVRSPNELAGCAPKPDDPNTSLFRIDVIKVPLAAPQTAKVIASPRVFAEAGKLAGIAHPASHGDTAMAASAPSNQCHDITVYAAIGLAAGACSGNGILLDIKNPGAPVRVAEVADPNFAYWHSATFNNAGTKVIYTDEWGGGVAPRCRASDNPKWGGDAIFTLAGHKLTEVGTYKMPAPQTEQENCVAHNGSLIPVPGRDILAQGWYQGGVSIYDFTDGAHPKELAYFDRGPMDSTKLYLSGEWAAYWYNGHIYGSEIGRGLDVFDLVPGPDLSQNEIDAAKLIHEDIDNPQAQQRIVWPASFSVSRAYVDQLVRENGLSSDKTSAISSALDAAEKMSAAGRRTALTKLASQIDGDAKDASDAAKVRDLSASVRKLAR